MMDDKLRAASYKALLQHVVEGVPIRIFWKDGDLRYLGCNSLFARDAGFPHPEELVGKTDFEMAWREVADRYREDDSLVMASGMPKLGYEEPITVADGSITWLRTSKVPLRDAAQNVIGILGIYEDITQQKQAIETQNRLTRAFKLLSRSNNTLIRATDESELLTAVCQLAVDVGGYRMAWVGIAEHDEAKTVRPMACAGQDAQVYLDGLTISWADESVHAQGPTGRAIRTRSTVVNQDVQLNPNLVPWRRAAMRYGYLSSISLPLISQGRMLGALSIYAGEEHAFSQEEVALLEELASDLAFGIDTLRTRSRHQEAERRLQYLAHYDPLTGLPNRILLQDRFQQAIAMAKRAHSGVAVLCLDLDNFKQINDGLGHDFGDRLLVNVAERLRGCIRSIDTLSRQGGDEFVILCTNVSEAEKIEEVVLGIANAFAEPFVLDDYTLHVSFSIGISLFPDDADDFATLLRQADTALNHVKESGRNHYHFFFEQLNSNALENMHLQGQLRQALANGELLLHYQPQIQLATGQVVGAEALIRWQHPELGLVPPGKFIPLAERCGLIIPIGEWVLEEACRQAREWQTAHGLQLTVAVNLSALQLKRGNLVQNVARALGRSGLAAHYLELELTETFLLQDMELVKTTLQGLKELGIRLSIDDFGTGYSNLSYLKQLEVDKLKVDQSFVRDMLNKPEDAAIVKAIIQLGHTLDLTVLAEGVEQPEQLALLQSLGSDEIQGFLFSRPLPARQFLEFCLTSAMTPNPLLTVLD